MLSVIMLYVVLLSVIMLYVVLLSVIMLNVIMLNGVTSHIKPHQARMEHKQETLTLNKPNLT